MSLPIRKRKLDECSLPKDDNDDRKKKAKDCEQKTTESMVHVNDCTEEMNDINNQDSSPLVSGSEEGSPPTESSTPTPAAASFVSNSSTSDSSFVCTAANNTTQNNSIGISINDSMSGRNDNNESFAVPMNMNDHRTYQQNPVPLPNNNNTKDKQHNSHTSSTALARPRSNSIFSKILQPGTKVQTILLAGRNQNGLMGSIVEYNSSNERYTVEIDNVDGSSGSKKRKKKKKERMFLKRRNLKRLKDNTNGSPVNDIDTTQDTNDVSGFTIKTEIGIVQPTDELEDDISSIKISDLMKELDSYGVNTSNFHDKSELVDALKRAREIISRPPQDATSSIRQSKQKSQRMIRMMCLLGGILLLITAALYSLKGMNGISSVSNNIKVEEEKYNVMYEEKEKATEEEKERREMIELVGSILQLKSEDKKDSYYDILGLETNCTSDDIKKAYRGRALKLHPDKNKYNTPNATQAFRAVGDVYNVLNDESARKRYDKRRFSSAPSSSPSSSKPGRDDDEYDRYGNEDDWHGYSYSRSRYRRRSSSRPYFNYDDDYGYKHKNVSDQEVFWGVMKMFVAGFGIIGVWAMFIKEILWTGSW